MAFDPFERQRRTEEVATAKESRESYNVLRRIIDELLTPSAYVILRTLDRTNRFKSYFKRSNIIEYSDFQKGQKIALIAIWQYELLRKDVRVFLEELKKRDYFICVVNTGKMEASYLSNLASVYIERFNYGRDFGSYKEGIQYLQNTEVFKDCSSFLMANDSVYYLQDFIGPTLDKLEVSESELTGLTENFEINHHLGSFFVVFSKRVVNGKYFKRFWRRLKTTDLRTRNIYYGEMMLTKKIGAKIPPDKIRVLWSISSMAAAIRDIETLSQAITLANRGHISTWKKISWQLISKAFLDERLIFMSDFQKKSGLTLSSSNGIDNDLSNSQLILGYNDLIHAIRDNFDSEISENSEYELLMKAKGLWLNIVGSGSQIHQNNNLFVHHGMPLVKLDLLYRGAFSYEDLEILLDKLQNREDSQILRSMLYRRIYGLDYLSGWRRSAFRKGMI